MRDDEKDRIGREREGREGRNREEGAGRKKLLDPQAMYWMHLVPP